MDIIVGDIIYVIHSFGINVRFLKGEVTATDKTKGEIQIAVLNNNRKPMKFYLFQDNVKILKNKKEARLVFVAKLCKKRDLQKNWEQIVESIKANTGLTNEDQIKEEIKNSQSQFPELWI